jgi:hypothetical protein
VIFRDQKRRTKIVGKMVSARTINTDFTAHVWIKENISCECILLFKDNPGKYRIVGKM